MNRGTRSADCRCVCARLETWKATPDRVRLSPVRPLVRRVLRADGGDDRGGTPRAVRGPPHHSQRQHLRDAHLGGEAGRVKQAAARSGPDPRLNCVLVSAEPRRLGHGHLRVPSGVGEGRRGHGAHLLWLGHAVRAVGADACRGLQLQATGEARRLLKHQMLARELRGSGSETQRCLI